MVYIYIYTLYQISKHMLIMCMQTYIYLTSWTNIITANDKYVYIYAYIYIIVVPFPGSRARNLAPPAGPSAQQKLF